MQVSVEKPSPTGRRTLLTIIQKIALGYMVTACFGLIATFFALNSLGQQTSQTNELINGDYHALMMATALRQDLLALDRLEKAEDVLSDVNLDSLRQHRRDGFLRNWEQLKQLPLSIPLPATLREAGDNFTAELEAHALKAAQPHANPDTLATTRQELLKQFDFFQKSREEIINASLAFLTDGSVRAYRLTLLLTLLGISIGVAVALSVILAIRRSTRDLIDATSRIANGDYNCGIDTRRNDEFGAISRAFVSMSNQLQHLEQIRLDANPLTHLPGNKAIDHEIEHRIGNGEAFAHIYIDIDNFKSFNDRYGYREGDKAIALVRDILKESLHEIGSRDHLLGHVGGDDYVVLTTPEDAESLSRLVISAFDQQAPLLYNNEDRATGFIVGIDRQGNEIRHPLMTLSVAVVTTDSLNQPSPAAISRECAKIKHHLKTLPGSNYLVDRREKR